jgi:DNA-binding NarL/FixJ family response regulator
MTITTGVALTPRQLEVLRAYVRTRSRKAAAAELGISVETVKKHVAGAYAVIGVDCLLDAAEWLRETK